ncbi:MAG: tetratricopeptide repeat protein [bacterium]|nr:tetratricopeptide repeat protein [bacterium]
MARQPKDPDAQIQTLEGVMENDPTSAAFFPLATLVSEKGDERRAESLLRSGLENHPAYAPARVLLAGLLITQEKTAEAVDHLEMAVRLTPWNLTALRLLAQCRRLAGDEAGARQALRVAGMFDPDDEEARSLLAEDVSVSLLSSAEAGASSEGSVLDVVPTPSLAELYRSQGHVKKAHEIYRKLLEDEPENTEWLEAAGSLKDLIDRGALDADVRPLAGAGEAGASDDLEDLFGDEEEATAEAPSGVEASAGDDLAGDDLEAPGLEDELDLGLLEGDESPAASFSGDAILDAGGGELDLSEDNLFDEFEEMESAASAPEEGWKAPAAGEAPAAAPSDAIELDEVSLDLEALEEDSLADLMEAAPAEAAAPAEEKSLAEAAGGEMDLLSGESPLGADFFEALETGEAPAAAPAAPEGEVPGTAPPEGLDSGDAFLLEEIELEPAGESETALELEEIAELSADEIALEEELTEMGAEMAIEAIEVPPEVLAMEAALDSLAEMAPAAAAPPDAGEKMELDPLLSGLVGLFLEEKDYARALDLFRKAEALGYGSASLTLRIQEIEENLRTSLTGDLQGSSGEDMGGSVPFGAISSGEVIARLEGWLKSIRRRKSRVPTGGESS